MVNKSTNINKMHHDFSPQIFEHKKTPWLTLFEIKFLAWDRHKNENGLICRQSVLQPTSHEYFAIVNYL